MRHGWLAMARWRRRSPGSRLPIAWRANTRSRCVVSWPRSAAWIRNMPNSGSHGRALTAGTISATSGSPAWSEALRKTDIRFVDLREDLDGIPGTYRKLDGHWSQKGEAIVADRIRKELGRLVNVQASRRSSF